MKKLIYSIIILLSVLFCSCGDNPSGPKTEGSSNETTIIGLWQVDQVQMVQAPVGNSISDIMKQALVPFGNVPASSVGSCVVSFNNDSSWNLNGSITNIVIKTICGVNQPNYTANGIFTTQNNNILFIVINYSGPHGNQTVGGGTYSLSSNLIINLNLANNEKWKIVLKRCHEVPNQITLLYPQNGDTTYFYNYFEWQNSELSTKYRFQNSIDSTFFYIETDTCITNVWYATEFVNHHRKYFWRVCGINNNGQGRWSEVWSVFVL